MSETDLQAKIDRLQAENDRLLHHLPIPKEGFLVVRQRLTSVQRIANRSIATEP
ncbi:hypothetical protein ACPOL_2666 [Acidisarcina polymorpha]|uniref:Uncharacterized protein n=1 Tax=Acidisarcina polymorpha TaxID=2211140 RepID=A0A2Z5FYN0_9BACT|nr:hypothetical protein ACPOL_2666 [Acidisarcina polymorpha]